jgi:hypothetical protein
MRSVLTSGGIPTFVTSQEWELVERCSQPLYKKDLKEFEAETARHLTTRGVLQRFYDADKGIYYTKNQNKGIE